MLSNLMSEFTTNKKAILEALRSVQARRLCKAADANGEHDYSISNISHDWADVLSAARKRFDQASSSPEPVSAKAEPDVNEDASNLTVDVSVYMQNMAGAADFDGADGHGTHDGLSNGAETEEQSEDQEETIKNLDRNLILAETKATILRQQLEMSEQKAEILREQLVQWQAESDALRRKMDELGNENVALSTQNKKLQADLERLETESQNISKSVNIAWQQGYLAGRAAAEEAGTESKSFAESLLDAANAATAYGAPQSAAEPEITPESDSGYFVADTPLEIDDPEVLNDPFTAKLLNALKQDCDDQEPIKSNSTEVPGQDHSEAIVEVITGEITPLTQAISAPAGQAIQQFNSQPHIEVAPPAVDDGWEIAETALNTGVAETEPAPTPAETAAPPLPRNVQVAAQKQAEVTEEVAKPSLSQVVTPPAPKVDLPTPPPLAAAAQTDSAASLKVTLVEGAVAPPRTDAGTPPLVEGAVAPPRTDTGTPSAGQVEGAVAPPRTDTGTPSAGQVEGAVAPPRAEGAVAPPRTEGAVPPPRTEGAVVPPRTEAGTPPAGQVEGAVPPPRPAAQAPQTDSAISQTVTMVEGTIPPPRDGATTPPPSIVEGAVPPSRAMAPEFESAESQTVTQVDPGAVRKATPLTPEEMSMFESHDGDSENMTGEIVEGNEKTTTFTADELHNLFRNRFVRPDEPEEQPKKEADPKAAGGAAKKFVGSKHQSATDPLPTMPRAFPPEIRKACKLLGLNPEELTRPVVFDAWKREMSKPGVHPDTGGDTEMAIYLNTAKDTLLRWVEDQTPKLGKKFGSSSQTKDQPKPQQNKPE